jgi:hypothetical protein
MWGEVSGRKVGKNCTASKRLVSYMNETAILNPLRSKQPVGSRILSCLNRSLLGFFIVQDSFPRFASGFHYNHRNHHHHTTEASTNISLKQHCHVASFYPHHEKCWQCHTAALPQTLMLLNFTHPISET